MRDDGSEPIERRLAVRRTVIFGVPRLAGRESRPEASANLTVAQPPALAVADSGEGTTSAESTMR